MFGCYLLFDLYFVVNLYFLMLELIEIGVDCVSVCGCWIMLQVLCYVDGLVELIVVWLIVDFVLVVDGVIWLICYFCIECVFDGLWLFVVVLWF